MAKKILSLVLALAMVSSFACISAFAADTPKVYDAVKDTLDLVGTFEASGVDGAIWAKNGAKLTINGEGTVKALLGTDQSTGKNYSMAVWAQGADTEVVINGGYYTNEVDPDYPSQADLIYASGDANITINGGTFECATPKWTLNCNDTSKGVITVKGGKFYQFDPSNTSVAPAGDTEIVVPAGYSVVKDGEWYEVVEANITFDSASSVIKDGKGALRFVFKVEIPEATKTYFGAYLLPLNIFNASGVSNAVQVQYDTEVATSSTFSADLVKIPQNYFGTSIYAIPYIKTANGVVTFTGETASVDSATSAQ